jgi:hypothetical protein
MLKESIMDKIEDIVSGLKSQITEVKEAFNSKYANYDNDKKELDTKVKGIEAEIKNQLKEYVSKKEVELKTAKEAIKALGEISGAKRSYKKNDTVVQEVVNVVATEIKSDTGFSMMSDKQDYLLKIVNSKVDEIASYKRAKAKDEISKKAVNKILEQLSISA